MFSCKCDNIKSKNVSPPQHQTTKKQSTNKDSITSLQQYLNNIPDTFKQKQILFDSIGRQ
jgi:hypothetical protein